MNGKCPVIRLKYLGKEPLKYGANEAAVGDEAEFPRFIRITDLNEDGTLRDDSFKSLEPKAAAPYLLLDGDLLFARSGATVGKAFFYTAAVGKACFAGYLVRFRPDQRKIEPRFAWYVTQSAIFREQVNAATIQATIQNVNADKYSNFSIPAPEISEQLTIVNFLDHETARIDDLIANKKKLVVLIEEKRISRISYLVTRGLDSNVTTKHSGVSIVGNIPAHWDVVRARVLYREIDERVTDAATDELLTVSHISGITPRSEKPDVTMFLAESLEDYKRCRKNDLVINTMWAWMGAVGVTRYDGVVSPSYNVYRLKRRMVPEYLDFLYRTREYIAEFTRWSKGVWVSRLRLYPDKFFQILTLLPPVEEQQDIVNAIRNEMGGYDKAIRVLQDSITRLSGYRTAIITAAVTGQIDVHSYRAREVAVCQ